MTEEQKELLKNWSEKLYETMSSEEDDGTYLLDIGADEVDKLIENIIKAKDAEAKQLVEAERERCLEILKTVQFNKIANDWKAIETFNAAVLVIKTLK